MLVKGYTAWPSPGDLHRSSTKNSSETFSWQREKSVLTCTTLSRALTFCIHPPPSPSLPFQLVSVAVVAHVSYRYQVAPGVCALFNAESSFFLSLSAPPPCLQQSAVPEPPCCA